jgi:hypothetical protein
VVVLILLFAVVAIAGSLVYVLLAEHRQLRGHDDRLQAMWLAESGVERASAQLAVSMDYEGETWLVPAAEIGGAQTGRIEIRVERVVDEPEMRRVHVTADYPADSVHRKRYSKQIDVALKTVGDSS